jgi:hypothetical protein
MTTPLLPRFILATVVVFGLLCMVDAMTPAGTGTGVATVGGRESKTLTLPNLPTATSGAYILWRYTVLSMTLAAADDSAAAAL